MTWVRQELATGDAATKARSRVRDVLEANGLPHLVDAASLLVADLVSTTCPRATGPLELTIIVGARSTTIAVADHSPNLAGPPGAGTAATSLRFVPGLADGWGRQHGPRGRRVWFRLDNA